MIEWKRKNHSVTQFRLQIHWNFRFQMIHLSSIVSFLSSASLYLMVEMLWQLPKTETEHTVWINCIAYVYKTTNCGALKRLTNKGFVCLIGFLIISRFYNKWNKHSKKYKHNIHNTKIQRPMLHKMLHDSFLKEMKSFDFWDFNFPWWKKKLLVSVEK